MLKRTMGSLMVLALVFAAQANADVIITGIVDGDLSGGNPKAIELYIDGSEDLSNYSLQRSSNGGSFGSTTALSGNYSDTFVYLIGTSNGGVAAFDSVFGTTGIFANRITSGTVTGNGNDAFRIVDGSNNVIDQVAPVSGSNSYQDSYMYRNDTTGPDGGWTDTNWSIPGNGVLDGLDASQHEATVPFGTYVIPEPASLALIALGGMLMLRRRSA